MRIRALADREAEAFLRDRRADSPALKLDWVPERPGCLFVCEEQDVLCGWLMAVPVSSRPGRGCLCNIWVEPAYRNQGVASSLMKEGMKWGLSHHFEEIELWVRENNSHARRLYQRLGFRESGWIRSSDSLDESLCVHMSLPIQPYRQPLMPVTT